MAMFVLLEKDLDLGVQADAKAALLRVGEPRVLQVIEALELGGFNRQILFRHRLIY